MAINFPSSPTLGQTTTINGVLYTFNGSAWIASVGLPFGETMPTTGQILKYDGARVVGESEADLLNVTDTPVDGVTSDSAAMAEIIAAQQGATARLLADGETVTMPDLEPVREVQLTKLQFLRRFTQAERIAIRASANPVIVDFLNMLDLAQDVRLKSWLSG